MIILSSTGAFIVMTSNWGLETGLSGMMRQIGRERMCEATLVVVAERKGFGIYIRVMLESI